MSLLTIVGPTGAGKTKFTKPLVEKGFEPINMDSFQLYDFFRLGTGRSDREGGHLYGILDPHAEINSALYLGLVAKALGSIACRGSQPVFEGGSLSLLRPLASEYDLKLIGIRPDPNVDIDAVAMQRGNAIGEEKLLDEVREGLRRGYRDTVVMRDDVVYLPLVEHVDGQITRDEAFDRICANLAAMRERQMSDYTTIPGIEWIDPPQLDQIII